MKKFRIIEHTADIAVEVSAPSLEKLFEYSAYAWLQSVAEINGADNIEDKSIELSSASREVLLVDFLSELNYLLNVKRWLFINVKSLAIEENSKYILKAIVAGTNLENADVKLKTEIKAVTFHQMNIEETGKEFKTKIIFDI